MRLRGLSIAARKVADELRARYALASCFCDLAPAGEVVDVECDRCAALRMARTLETAEAKS
jgi:hypothetical protein